MEAQNRTTIALTGDFARLEINLSLIKQTNGGRKCGIVTRPDRSN